MTIESRGIEDTKNISRESEPNQRKGSINNFT